MIARTALALLATLGAACAAEPVPPALAAAQAEVERVWQTVPLTVRTALFIREPSAGYGMYVPRPDDVFKPGEDLVTYIEPLGYGWKDLGDGRFGIGFATDLEVLDAEGKSMGTKQNFLEVAKETRTRNKEFSIDLTLTLTGFPAGRYTVVYTLHDTTSGKSASVRQPFEIAAAPR